MSDQQAENPLRAAILDNLAQVLDDHEVMRALLDASGGRTGKVVDLRAAVVDRLESRLLRIEEVNRNVIAAAYDNLSGTNQIHRAVTTLLEPQGLDGFLDALGNEVARILAVDVVRLCLESPDPAPALPHPAVTMLEPGAIRTYLTRGADVALRRVTLRAAPPDRQRVFTATAGRVGSEALIRLDLGAQTLPALLALGARDMEKFTPEQGVDLLTFLGAVTERILRRHLA